MGWPGVEDNWDAVREGRTTGPVNKDLVCRPGGDARVHDVPGGTRVGRMAPIISRGVCGGERRWTTEKRRAAIAQGTMLYVSELTWNGKENVE